MAAVKASEKGTRSEMRPGTTSETETRLWTNEMETQSGTLSSGETGAVTKIRVTVES